MQKLVLFLVVLGLLAGGAWLFSGLSSGAEAAPAATVVLEQEGGSEADGRRARQWESDSELPTPRTARTVAAAERAPDDDRFAYRIHVVRHPGGQPVAGAEVFWLPSDFDWAALTDEDRELLSRDDVRFHEVHGESALTDDAGRATVLADPDRTLSLLGRSGDLYGRDWFRAKESDSEGPPDPGREFTLTLREDRVLCVRAVDGTGRPLPGVRIRFVRRVEGDDSVSRSTLGPTDEDGIVRVPHVQEHVPLDGPEAHAMLAVQCFGGAGEAVRVDLADLPREPVDVVAPPSGSVEILLLGPDGRPWPLAGEQEVRVWIQRAGESRSWVAATDNSVLLGRDGRAIAEPVLCGREYRIWSWTGTRHEEVVQGPRRQGERVRVEFRMPEDTPILIGRLVDGQGAPVRGPVHLEYEHSGSSGSLQLGVDDEGRFRVPLRESLVGRSPTVTFTLREGSGMLTDTSGQATLPGPLTSGPNDLGNVVLTEAPLLVAGRVEWTDGTPVEPPQVELERSRLAVAGYWEQAGDLRPVLPGQGRFVVRGLHQDRRWRLRVTGDCQPVAPIPFQPGTRDLVVRVAKGGSVRASFLVEGGMVSGWRQAGTLEFRLQPALRLPPVDRRDHLERHRREMAEEGWSQPTDDGVTCRWTGLAPGDYRMTVRCPGVPEPVVDVPGIAVPPGGAAEDPRLVDIDLRGRVRRIHVTVTDSQGHPIRDDEGAVVLRGGDDPEVTWHGRMLVGDDGRVPFVLSRPVDLVVAVPGFRTREVPGVFGDATVALERGLEVRLRLAAELPELPGEIGALLFVGQAAERNTALRYRVHDGRGSSRSNTVSMLLGDGVQRIPLKDGIARYSVVHSGPRNLRLRLHRRVERRLQTRYVAVRPATLDLDALRPGQEIEVRFDPAAVRTAIEELMR